MAMESTGVYWIPLFQILEERGFEPALLMREASGRFIKAPGDRNKGGVQGIGARRCEVLCNQQVSWGRRLVNRGTRRRPGCLLRPSMVNSATRALWALLNFSSQV